MCRRADSIEKMSNAADRLTEACEDHIAGVCRLAVDPAQPVRSGISRALKKAIREMSPTPTDMALQLRKIR